MEINHIKILCEELLKETVTDISPVLGGDVNLSYQIDTPSNTYFCKTNHSDIGEDLLQKEEIALNILQRYCKTPNIIASAPKMLIMNWVKSTSKSKRFWQNLGNELADIHNVTSNKFGFDNDNYIGTLHQTNTSQDTWSAFYVSQRLQPQLKLAIDRGLLSASNMPSANLMDKIVNIVCPNEPASLIHGDLWSGNIMCNENSEAYFVDPCISYSHREMDIAMSTLFGKFDTSFYETYQEARPMDGDYKDRFDMYQLYYLLAHLNMFGIGYKNDVIKILNRYFQ